MSGPAPTEPPAGTAEGGATAKGETTVTELSRPQLAAARRIAEAKATVPHLYSSTPATVGPHPAEGVQPVDLLIRASALALREQPRVNSSYRDGRVSEHGRVNVAFELAGAAAHLAPVIADADRRGAEEIASLRTRLSARAAAGEITPPELAGATFTVSAVAADGVRSMLAVVHPPQVAILAAGAPGHGPDADAEQIMLSLSFDGRALDAGRGSAFLARVRSLLEDPDRSRL